MTASFLILRIGDSRLALPMAVVREVLPMLPIDAAPGLPRPLLGFVTLQDRPVPVLAPGLLLAPDAPVGSIGLFAHLVRLRDDLCLLVDRAEDVAQGDVAPLDPAHSLNAAIAGELTLADGGTAHVVAPDRLLLDAERAVLATLTAAATARRDQWTAA
ncbi:chemotaxis protein CheW [Sphingomonas sp. 2R-10]|uniref:chemotaxis protein CheW n=1 Tax=Sphingomonas sp. 2R-10 TaxID=3045148 RepID=UPI000F76709D|nr:chemotaxis protein CheW [Sphingomonas sp. 2R-10]MDJ0277744.1 chemotaxis protein CheW [Sphingomonas sp. 2R-10]